MTKDKTGALAIFVKTPGFSPIKTRLAASIGQARAEWFHLLSAQAIQSVVMRASANIAGFTPYWAVAEKDAMNAPLWREFRTIWQGEGSLGERLDHVYSELLQKHSFVIFIGADSPHLSDRILREASSTLSQRSNDVSYVLGRADDGGFYLFGGASPVPRASWLEVPYSTERTAELLAAKLTEYGKIAELPQLLDVDTLEDMQRLAAIAETSPEQTVEQKTLINSIREYLREKT